MVNRLESYFEEPPERTPAGDYWEVCGPTVWFCVDEATARELIGQLGRRVPPRWLRFTDFFGAAVRVRSREVRLVIECTAEQRAAGREFRKARQREEASDRKPWEDSD